ncbi:MAG: alpha/beta hydrolase [Streptosporangiaceae bacterium]
MAAEADLTLADGRTLHYYDTGGAGQVVFWHHGTPNIGSPPEPLFDAAARNGLRWVSYDRPAYGGSSPDPGRTVASAAADVAAIADAVGAARFAVLGHSGGGPHALACAALLPDRVIAAVSGAAPAPYDADGLDWHAGWTPGIAAENRAAAAGREALEYHLAHAEPEDMAAFFTDGDLAALGGRWSWVGSVAGAAMEQGNDGAIEDGLAAVAPWGYAPADITVPVLLLHGTADKMVPSAHGEWLAAHCPAAELRLVPDAGHITVLDEAPAALEWIGERAAATPR